MVKTRSVKFNFAMNVILTASTMIFPLITFPYISRILLPAGVGKVNFATSVVSYFSMIAMLGVPVYGVRACAQVRDNKEELSRTVQEILFINLIMGSVIYIFYFLALWNIARLREDSALFYVMSTTIFFNVIGVEWLYKGLEQYSYITARSIVFKFIGLLLMFILVRDKEDYVIYAAITIVAGVGSNILNFFYLRNYIDLHPVGHYHIRRHLKAVIVFFLMSVATTIYTNLDTVMLGFMKNDAEVGYYTAAVKVKTILVSFVTALSAVLLPRVSYYVEQGLQQEFLKVSRKALNFVVVAAVPVTVYFILYAEEAILLLSGKDFGNAVLPMQIIMPTVLFIGITNVLGIQILVPLGKEKLVFYSVLIGAIVDLFINAIYIPSMASAGAALGTVIAEFVVFIVQMLMLSRQAKDLFEEVQLGKILAATGCGILSCMWIRDMSWMNFWKLVASGSMFMCGYGIVLIIVKEKFVWNIVNEFVTRMKWKK